MARRVLTALPAIAWVLFLAPAASAGTSLGGIAVRPAQYSKANPATRSYFVLRQATGSTRHDAAIVTNDSRSRLTLYVDPVDGLTGVTSGVVYGNRGIPLRAAGKWITPQTRELVLPPLSARRIAFAAHVPASASPGDHVAGLAFQASTPARTTNGRVSVKIVLRSVIGIEIIVPGSAQARVRISKLALAPLPGTDVPSAVLTMEDAGRLLCKPRLAVSIQGAGQAQTFSQTLDTILPGDRIAFPFRWPGRLVAGGRYDVSVRATRCGSVVARSASATYSLPRPSAGKAAVTPSAGIAAPLNSSSHNHWLLYALIALVALGAGAGLGQLGRRQRHRN